MPISTACWIVLIESSSLFSPHPPPIAQVPKPIREIALGISAQLIVSVIIFKRVIAGSVASVSGQLPVRGASGPVSVFGQCERRPFGARSVAIIIGRSPVKGRPSGPNVGRSGDGLGKAFVEGGIGLKKLVQVWFFAVLLGREAPP